VVAAYINAAVAVQEQSGPGQRGGNWNRREPPNHATLGKGSKLLFLPPGLNRPNLSQLRLIPRSEVRSLPGPSLAAALQPGYGKMPSPGEVSRGPFARQSADQYGCPAHLA
jgi:hypothetical protein